MTVQDFKTVMGLAFGLISSSEMKRASCRKLDGSTSPAALVSRVVALGLSLTDRI